jgi:hypothetical protein
MSDISTIKWNEDLVFLGPWRIFLFLAAAGLVGRELNLIFYMKWSVEILNCILGPILFIAFTASITLIAGWLYWFIRWIVIFNGPIIGTATWWFINVSTFCLVDVYTLETIVKNGIELGRFTYVWLIDHKRHVSRQYIRWKRGMEPL